MDWNRIRDWYRPRGDAWFVPKFSGFGATPASWQGWLVTAAFIAVELAVVMWMPGGEADRAAVALLLVVPFVTLVYAKTDGAWRWRWWGGSKD